MKLKFLCRNEISLCALLLLPLLSTAFDKRNQARAIQIIINHPGEHPGEQLEEQPGEQLNNKKSFHGKPVGINVYINAGDKANSCGKKSCKQQGESGQGYAPRTEKWVSQSHKHNEERENNLYNQVDENLEKPWHNQNNRPPYNKYVVPKKRRHTKPNGDSLMYPVLDNKPKKQKPHRYLPGIQGHVPKTDKWISEAQKNKEEREDNQYNQVNEHIEKIWHNQNERPPSNKPPVVHREKKHKRDLQDQLGGPGQGYNPSTKKWWFEKQKNNEETVNDQYNQVDENLEKIWNNQNERSPCNKPPVVHREKRPKRDQQDQPGGPGQGYNPSTKKWWFEKQKNNEETENDQYNQVDENLEQTWHNQNERPPCNKPPVVHREKRHKRDQQTNQKYQQDQLGAHVQGQNPSNKKYWFENQKNNEETVNDQYNQVDENLEKIWNNQNERSPCNKPPVVHREKRPKRDQQDQPGGPGQGYNPSTKKYWFENQKNNEETENDQYNQVDENLEKIWNNQNERSPCNKPPVVHREKRPKRDQQDQPGGPGQGYNPSNKKYWFENQKNNEETENDQYNQVDENLEKIWNNQNERSPCNKPPVVHREKRPKRDQQDQPGGPGQGYNPSTKKYWFENQKNNEETENDQYNQVDENLEQTWHNQYDRPPCNQQILPREKRRKRPNGDLITSHVDSPFDNPLNKPRYQRDLLGEPVQGNDPSNQKYWFEKQGNNEGPLEPESGELPPGRRTRNQSSWNIEKTEDNEYTKLKKKSKKTWRSPQSQAQTREQDPYHETDQITNPEEQQGDEEEDELLEQMLIDEEPSARQGTQQEYNQQDQQREEEFEPLQEMFMNDAPTAKKVMKGRKNRHAVNNGHQKHFFS